MTTLREEPEWAQSYWRYKSDRSAPGLPSVMIDVQENDAGMADCYARMAKIASDALGDREQFPNSIRTPGRATASALAEA